MAHIIDNTDIFIIMTSNCIKVINDTSYLLLCIRGLIVLMSDGKLYRIGRTKHGTYELAKISLQSDENYVVAVDDFTRGLAKINDKYYDIL